MAAARIWAAVPAAGRGARMGAGVPKQYLPLRGRPLIMHTLARLAACEAVAGVAVGIAPADREWPALAREAPRLVCTAAGGAERAHTVLSILGALSAHAQEDDWVLVHDAVRPCLRAEDINRLIAETGGHADGGLLAIPLSDTLKRADDHRRVAVTVDRRDLWRALTPQLFPLAVLRRALERALADGAEVTDEAMAVERLGGHPRLVEGHPDNIKVTRPEDLALAELFLRQQDREADR